MAYYAADPEKIAPKISAQAESVVVGEIMSFETGRAETLHQGRRVICDGAEATLAFGAGLRRPISRNTPSSDGYPARVIASNTEAR